MGSEETSRGTAMDHAPLTVRRWSLEEWLANEVAWTSLVERSATDALFLSWDWLTIWWQCYGRSVGGEPEILAFYRGTQLVGLAPLYCRRLVRGGFVPTRSVQLIGLSWRDEVPLISEYLDVIAAAPDLERCASLACASCWPSRTGRNLWSDSPPWAARWRDLYTRCASPLGHYVRELDSSTVVPGGPDRRLRRLPARSGTVDPTQHLEPAPTPCRIRRSAVAASTAA